MHLYSDWLHGFRKIVPGGKLVFALTLEKMKAGGRLWVLISKEPFRIFLLYTVQTRFHRHPLLQILYRFVVYYPTETVPGMFVEC